MRALFNRGARLHRSLGAISYFRARYLAFRLKQLRSLLCCASHHQVQVGQYGAYSLVHLAWVLSARSAYLYDEDKILRI